MGQWTLDDIAWDRFDRSKVDPDMLLIVKAASMVEHNGDDYATYLCNVFHDDPEFQAEAKAWAIEEVQHGVALARWAKLADPSFDFDASFSAFADGYKLDLSTDTSIRGSRSGELVARCIVETGTSSFYSALADETDEPVLEQICRRIAADELRHYKLFYKSMKRYMDLEQLTKLERMKVAFGRIFETENDELAYAYYAANRLGQAYDHKRDTREYMRRAYAVYRKPHIDRAMAMIFKAIGLDPQGRLHALLSWVMYQAMSKRRLMMDWMARGNPPAPQPV